MPDDLTALAVDEGPGAFMPRPEHASDAALARLHTRGLGSDSAPSSEAAKSESADPKKKAKRKAARAARRKNR
jgi:hypothetical protein